MLYSDSAGCYLLGCLCNNPNLIRNGKYPLSKEDFEPNILHKYLFVAINNLAYKGLEEITEIEIDQFIQPYPAVKETIEDEDGLNFIRIVKKQSGSSSIDLYYPIVRKFALLREAKNRGIDISDIYDELLDTESQMAQLNNYSIDEILNIFDSRVIQLKKQYSLDTIREEMWAGENFEEVLEQFEKTPVMGAGLSSPYETSIFRGWQRGHLILRSAPSGCVDCDTEYFNGKTWKRIADYKTGEKVLQYNEDGTAEMVEPSAYIKLPCNTLYNFENDFGVSQVLSSEHKIVYRNKKNKIKKISARRMMMKPKFTGNLITTFHFRGVGADLTDSELKLFGALCNLTNFGLEGKVTASGKKLHYVAKISDETKVTRLRELLEVNKVVWTEKEVITNPSEYTEFHIYGIDYVQKVLSQWSKCSSRQLILLCDEVLSWGCDIKVYIKEVINFIQFAFSFYDVTATIETSKPFYTLTLRNSKSRNYSGFRVNKVNSVTGYKYCFTVPSHMLVLRRDGKIFITGNSGKSTRVIGDLCNVCCSHLWSDEENKFIENLNYQGKGFYIHTEMNQKLEIQPKFISYISNIPYNLILDGNYTAKQKQRLLQASEILKESGIKLIDMPQFTIPLLRNTIKEMAITEQCKYGVFDYVQDNGIAGKLYKTETGTALRQDMLLLAIVTDLKACAEEYDVGILSMTQLNGQEKVLPVIDEHCLFGSKSMKNKIDGGCIMLPPSKKELEQTELLSEKRGFGNIKPNIVSHIYKGRFSQYGTNLKIFQIVDLSTGRIEDCYVTNVYNEPVHVDKTYIEN